MEKPLATIDLLIDLWPKIRLDVKTRLRLFEDFLVECEPASVTAATADITTVGLVSSRTDLSQWEDESRVLGDVIGRLLNQWVMVKIEPRPANLATMPYDEYLRTNHWIETAKSAKDRAGNRCQVCNAASTLHTHHRTYERRGDEREDDLIVLCAGCHQLFHDHGKLARS